MRCIIMQHERVCRRGYIEAIYLLPTQLSIYSPIYATDVPKGEVRVRVAADATPSGSLNSEPLPSANTRGDPTERHEDDTGD